MEETVKALEKENMTFKTRIDLLQKDFQKQQSHSKSLERALLALAKEVKKHYPEVTEITTEPIEDKD